MKLKPILTLFILFSSTSVLALDIVFIGQCKGSIETASFYEASYVESLQEDPLFWKKEGGSLVNYCPVENTQCDKEGTRIISTEFNTDVLLYGEELKKLKKIQFEVNYYSDNNSLVETNYLTIKHDGSNYSRIPKSKLFKEKVSGLKSYQRAKKIEVIITNLNDIYFKFGYTCPKVEKPQFKKIESSAKFKLLKTSVPKNEIGLLMYCIPEQKSKYFKTDKLISESDFKNNTPPNSCLYLTPDYVNEIILSEFDLDADIYLVFPERVFGKKLIKFFESVFGDIDEKNETVYIGYRNTLKNCIGCSSLKQKCKVYKATSTMGMLREPIRERNKFRFQKFSLSENIKRYRIPEFFIVHEKKETNTIATTKIFDQKILEECDETFF
tara:strand:+ start:54493 stop:55641 length:1149 start_codon:yes stop_codon:yes gene_type:complete